MEFMLWKQLEKQNMLRLAGRKLGLPIIRLGCGYASLEPLPRFTAIRKWDRNGHQKGDYPQKKQINMTYLHHLEVT